MVGVEWIDFWDVGQGDSSVIHLSDGTLILVDLGRKKSAVTAWLRGLPDIHIRAVLITHIHADHVGGLESLLKSGLEIDKVGVVHHGHVSDPKVEKLVQLFEPFEEAKKLRIVQSGDVFWEDGDWSLVAFQPTPTSYFKEKDIDYRSACYSLNFRGGIQVLWPGDAPLSKIEETLKGQRVRMMVGPHHGNPKDSKARDFESRISRISQDRSFISVGTNGYRTCPDEVYIRGLRAKGCSVSCSQITERCGREWKGKYDKIIDGTQLLGLHGGVTEVDTSVPCRGTMRMEWSDSEHRFLPDRFENQHRKYIQMRVPKALCG